DGVLNVVTGPGSSTGSALPGHPGVDKIAFTGETSTGVSILQLAAPNITRVSLELGGKSPNIIFADADLEKAAPAAVNSVFGNAGQDCCARSRAFVHRAIAEEFDQRVAAGARKLNIGDPLDARTDVGPLISMKQHERVQNYIQLGRQEGARLLAGGSAPGGHLAAGSFLEPTVFDHAENGMRIAQEEIFGPVLTIIPFADEDEVLRLVNDTPYGLSGSIWTRDIGRALRVARGVKTGVLSINSSRSVHQEAPFGGYKRSGIGRELGMHALQLYTDVENEPLPGFKFSNWGTGYGDMHGHPDLSTIRRIPWLEKTALILCDIETMDGKSVDIAPRQILRRQVERARKLGFIPKTGSELEFYLFKDSYEQAAEKDYRNLQTYGRYIEDYHILQGTKAEWFNRLVRNGMEGAAVPVENSKGEWGFGQQEINLRFAESLEMAD